MTYRKIATLLVLLAGLASFAFAQTSLTQTTLSGAQTISPFSGTVTLAACTGVTAPVLPGTPTSVIYVGGEAEGILSWNSTSCSGVVLRGYLGTRASDHLSGDMVLISVAYQTTLAQGANPQPNGFFDKDPPLNGACTTANTATTPYVNVLTGAQWLCSTVTKTWVPGFNNPLASVAAKVTANVASTTAMLPSGVLFHVTGTSGFTMITVPVGFNATATGGGSFCTIPDGAYTTTAGNNIKKSSTAVVGQVLCFIWDAANSLFDATY